MKIKNTYVVLTLLIVAGLHMKESSGSWTPEANVIYGSIGSFAMIENVARAGERDFVDAVNSTVAVSSYSVVDLAVGNYLSPFARQRLADLALFQAAYDNDGGAAIKLLTSTTTRPTSFAIDASCYVVSKYAGGLAAQVSQAFKAYNPGGSCSTVVNSCPGLNLKKPSARRCPAGMPMSASR